MEKLGSYRLNILQQIADQIDSEKYHSFTVTQIENGQIISHDDYDEDYIIPCDDGIWLVPDEARFMGDFGEFMGTSYEQAKYNIGVFVESLNGRV